MKKNNSFPTMLIEMYHIGEVSEEERKFIEAELAVNDELRSYYKSLAESDRELLERYPLENQPKLVRYMESLSKSSAGKDGIWLIVDNTTTDTFVPEPIPAIQLLAADTGKGVPKEVKQEEVFIKGIHNRIGSLIIMKEIEGDDIKIWFLYKSVKNNEFKFNISKLTFSLISENQKGNVYTSHFKADAFNENCFKSQEKFSILLSSSLEIHKIEFTPVE